MDIPWSWDCSLHSITEFGKILDTTSVSTTKEKSDSAAIFPMHGHSAPSLCSHTIELLLWASCTERKFMTLSEKRELSIDPSIPSLYSSAIRIFLPLIFSESFFFLVNRGRENAIFIFHNWKTGKWDLSATETACLGLTSVKAESGVKLPLYESGTFSDHLLVWNLSKFLNLSELRCPYLDIP